jgi:hypothetical protein
MVALMNILIETIDHDKQRYPTVGDWQIDAEKDTILIRVSKIGNWRYELLVGIHELVEVLLCLDRGITDEQVTAFDVEYEKKRSKDSHDEPGDDPHAPYRAEHFFATNLERLLSAELSVNWLDYEKAIDDL